MDASGALATIAQLAMAVTGFAGLLTVFRSSRRRWHEIELVALRFLLMTSISACVLSLLPLVLQESPDSRSVPWRICQAALGIWLFFLFVWQHRQERLRGLRPRSPSINAAMWVAGIATALANLIVAAGLTAALSPAVVYLIGLLWLLLGAILQFVVQIISSVSVDTK